MHVACSMLMLYNYSEVFAAVYFTNINYSLVHFQSHLNVLLKGEALQHGNAHFVNNIVDIFCW